MRLAIFRFVFPMLLIMSGCEPSWGAQFPNEAKLYERNGHKYFGKVIGYESRHDFHNGTAAAAAVLIEPAEAGQPPQWGSCATCAIMLEIFAP